MVRFLTVFFAILSVAISAPLAASPMDEIRALLDADKGAEAFELAKDYAAKDDPAAHEALGWFYEQGIVAEQDSARAAVHFEKAAMGGRKIAQWKYGVMLDTGQGVAENSDQAFYWFTKSSEQDYARAWVSLGVLYATGRGTELDYEKSMAAYQRGAQLKESRGFYGIGALYASGQGVETDFAEAAAYMAVSANMGDELAEEGLDRITEKFSDELLVMVAERATAIAAEYDMPHLKFQAGEES